jgi:lysophospholipid acyltransferase (LPLAT)-like uncharacterized protein
LLTKLLFLTYRIKIIDKIPTTGVFYTWHQNIIAASAFFNKKNINSHCIISPSKDGKFVGDIAKKFGFKVLYGSAYKKPLQLIRESLKILQKEKKLFVIGDGSRGPAKKLQSGVIYFAKKTGLPLVFIDCDVSWKIRCKNSWDQFQIPLPFSKIMIRLCSSK